MPLREKLRKALHRDEGSSGPPPRQAQDASATSGSNPANSTDAGFSEADRQTTSKATRSNDVMDHARVPEKVRSNLYSEDVADWNIVQANKPRNQSAIPAASKVNKNSGEHLYQSSSGQGVQHDRAPTSRQIPASSSALPGGRARGESISRKAVASSPMTTADRGSHPLDLPDLRERVVVEKPASTPSTAEPVTRDVATSKHAKPNHHVVKDAAEAPSLEGVVDLRNTVDTTTDEKWAPAVTHETVNREVHHIREEQITREIHTHDVYHRVLPIIDVEVLPARHFVPDGKGGRIEISEAEIPGRAGPYRPNWAIVETVSKEHTVHEPRRFTARDFHDTEGDYKEYNSPQGVFTTETTWVHPPRIEDHAHLSGQTMPFHFGSIDPREDGLRVHAPTGPVTGASHMLAEGRQAVSPPVDDMSKLSLNEAVSKSAPKASASSTGNGVLAPLETATKTAFPDGVEDPRSAPA